MSPFERIAALIRQSVEGRSFICASDVLVGAAHDALRLQDLGARAMAVGASRGTGTLPAAVETIDLGMPPASSMMAGVRAGQGMMEALPPEVLARLDAFDPERRARVILPLFGTASHIAGRAVWGARPPGWVALEDKTLVDAVWDRVGVPRAPSQVVPLEEGAAWAAHRALDEGEGTVWAADNTLGWHGGGEYTRRVRSVVEARATLAEWAGAARRLRVMPFLDGVPCSIHGIVFPDHVVVLRPCEMMVLRHPGSRSFRYAQAATFWDPPEADRAVMRQTARRVGAWLRSEVGFRGTFTIDGVMTAHGFRPTELNPRFGAAIGVMGRGMKGLSLWLLHLAVVEGLELDWQPVEIEAALLEAADAHRAAGGMVLVQRRLEAGRHSWGRGRDGRWQPAEPGEVQVEIGPSASGSIVFCRFQPGSLEVGRAVAPVLAGLLTELDGPLGLGLGRVEAAPEIRC